ncbi:MAG TPA: hypothetical protein PKC45_19220 [Gemmatales bacterium]|nr:hypothetical protein [Gemmatales bacterium]
MGADATTWIGLAEVRGLTPASFLSDATQGAFVNVVGLATNAGTFARLTAEHCREIDLELLDLTDVEPFDERIKKYRVDVELKELVAQLSPGSPVLFGVFVVFPEE